MSPMRSFDDLVAEAASADVTGWGFGWLDGRATEQRPAWGYSRLLAARPVPFPDESFELVTARHPVRPDWSEIRRLLVPGGHYFAQHVGPASAFELIEFFLGPLPEHRQGRDPEREAAQAREAGLTVTDLRTARSRMEFFDVGAVVWTLRKCVWWTGLLGRPVPRQAPGAGRPDPAPGCLRRALDAPPRRSPAPGCLGQSLFAFGRCVAGRGRRVGRGPWARESAARC